ncbi:unnamed protein product [Camellia sinensis]
MESESSNGDSEVQGMMLELLNQLDGFEHLTKSNAYVTVPSLASVYNEYALKSQYDTSIYLQSPSSFDIFEGHSKATMLLIFNNVAQGILSSFFFKYADTILKKYSSTAATIFTGIASAALFGHSDYKLYVRNYSCFHLNAPFFSPLSKVKDEQQNGVVELKDVQDNHRTEDRLAKFASSEKIFVYKLGQAFVTIGIVSLGIWMSSLLSA